MIKDLIRVGPPQGTINDLDLGLQNKEFDKSLKKDFEKELHRDKPSRDLDQVSKKSSGGIKKKMTRAKGEESDAEKPDTDAKAEKRVQPQAVNEKISKVMVSQEDEVEIADSDKDLQDNASEQANIQNMQAQLLAAQLAAAGLAMPAEQSAEEQVTAAQGEAQAAQQQNFQYLTNAEKALLADIGTEAEVDPNLGLGQEALPPNVDLAAETANQLQTTDLKSTAAQMPTQDAKAKEEKQPTELESRIFNILSKENAQPGMDQKLVQQDVSSKTEQSQALNQTNAVLAKSSAEGEQKQQGESSQQKSGGDSPSQGMPKFDASNDLASQVQALHAGQRSSFQSHLGAAAGIGGATKPEAMTDAVKDENIREIMNQAKFLVTKGGGEMTVRMTPEGMGEVQLKVALDNGKINIEMNSQDKQVKKMIEESLSDLKSSLASHQMRVEHVKINNVTAVDTNNQSQFQSDANSSNSGFQNRQQQEMNFQNMANSNSGRQGQQQERGSGSYQTVQAPTVKPVAKANAYAAANKGSSINMVA